MFLCAPLPERYVSLGSVEFSKLLIEEGVAGRGFTGRRIRANGAKASVRFALRSKTSTARARRRGRSGSFCGTDSTHRLKSCATIVGQ